VKSRLTAVSISIAICLAILGTRSAASGASTQKQQQIARGEYLVKAIGQCGDCHTPFDDKGEFVQSKWLRGKKLEFAPMTPMPGWADTSPNIAGLQGWDPAQAVRFFMTGLAPNGQPARPPMPQYRMHRADAEAVVAYLESLR
jgi:mono/diheme cytochrome c family protein